MKKHWSSRTKISSLCEWRLIDANAWSIIFNRVLCVSQSIRLVTDRIYRVRTHAPGAIPSRLSAARIHFHISTLSPIGAMSLVHSRCRNISYRQSLPGWACRPVSLLPSRCPLSRDLIPTNNRSHHSNLY